MNRETRLPRAWVVLCVFSVPKGCFGSARDGHGRRQRSFDPVHGQGPLPGLTANWKSRIGAATEHAEKQTFNVRFERLSIASSM